MGIRELVLNFHAIKFPRPRRANCHSTAAVITSQGRLIHRRATAHKIPTDTGVSRLETLLRMCFEDRVMK